MGRFMLYVIIFVVAALAMAWIALPREPVDTVIDFDPATIEPDLDAHLARVEAAFDDITPGVEKRIVWAGATGQPTAQVLVYLHGFSATSEEIRPVPDRVAQALGANLLFWRLPGHGRGGDAMAEPSAGDWIDSTAHALAVAARLGDEVIVLSTSTGGTLAAIAAVHPDLSAGIDRLVFVSPNFELANPAARILTWPGVRLWAPLVAGRERGFQPSSDDHARYWTTRYPTVAAVPLGAVAAYARSLDYGTARQPALFVFSDDDQVVSAAATRRIAGTWGGPAALAPQTVGPGNDPSSHVIAGDIMSPGLTEPVTRAILDWLRGG